MVDFSTLLRKPAGEAKKPKALPAGVYEGIIKTWQVGDQNKNRTPYVRFTCALTSWPADLDESNREGLDLTKRQPRQDYFLTDDALFRLDELIRSCGIDPSGRQYEDVLPELVGQTVQLEIVQYINQQTNEIGDQVRGMKGLA